MEYYAVESIGRDIRQIVFAGTSEDVWRNAFDRKINEDAINDYCLRTISEDMCTFIRHHIALSAVFDTYIEITIDGNDITVMVHVTDDDVIPSVYYGE